MEILQNLPKKSMKLRKYSLRNLHKKNCIVLLTCPPTTVAPVTVILEGIPHVALLPVEQQYI